MPVCLNVMHFGAADQNFCIYLFLNRPTSRDKEEEEREETKFHPMFFFPPSVESSLVRLDNKIFFLYICKHALHM
jgi:hypothetical protein